VALLAGAPLEDSVIETDTLPPAPPSTSGSLTDLLRRVSDLETQMRRPLYMAKTWLLWFINTLQPAVQSSSQVLKVVTLTAQSATIGLTAVPLGSLSAGLYRVSYYARITNPDGVSSSLTIALGWTESAESLSLSGAPITGDSITSVQTGVAVIQSDASGAITYGATYASNTPAKMQFTLIVVVERIQ